jgi:hypothetical protein
MIVLRLIRERFPSLPATLAAGSRGRKPDMQKSALASLEALGAGADGSTSLAARSSFCTGYSR